MTHVKWLIAGLAASAMALSASAGVAQDKTVKLSIVSFLSGPAAGPFGVPSRNAAELVVAAINDGKLPAPYDSKGFAGAAAEVEFVDENGGNTKVVAEYRNMVQKRGADVVLGYISSGSCAALAPVVEELQKLTIFSVCGTPRVFEEAPRKFVFRTMSHATSDGVAAAHYVREMFPDMKQYVGINQNYAWGQDSWRDFDLAFKALDTAAKPSEKSQWPKLFQGQYGTEISALLLDESPLVHSSFWDGDLEAFMFQAATRGLFEKKKVLLTVADTAAYRLAKRMPDGIILGARGPYGILVRDRDSALNKWFIQAYFDRYGTYPLGPSYQYAQSVLALKFAYDKAAAAAGGFPSQQQVIDALRGAEFESFSTTVKMSLAGGHQAVTENGYGITRYDDAAGEVKMVDVKFYSAECVNPPEGVTAVEWIEGGMKGAKCN